MQFLFFHLMPYADLDLALKDRYGTTWLTFPNKYYDPKKGRALYDRYLGELERAEALGFDGVALNEHHQTAYGLMPSPIVTASALARTTSRVKIAILGSAALLRENPLAIAEEHAMIDNITGGRLISSFVRGIGSEYHIWHVNPTHSYERYAESHDLIVRAWTEPGPFAFEGKHFHFPYVNLWPRPYQQPHPVIWCPSNGSSETIEFAVHPDRKYIYAQTFNTEKAAERFFGMYYEAAARAGWTATPEKVAWGGPCYCAETDEIALRESKAHIESLFNVFLPKPLEMFIPPGYTSTASLKLLLQNKGVLAGNVTAEDLRDSGLYLCGSPATLRERMTTFAARYGIGNWILMLQFGTLPADLTAKSMELFAREVMPALRMSARTAKAAE
jgi:alkanesulfonate monooxygenase SsuD/methylene tetrahydromethanopterin reductase-like flavin-dependent oxidoreductase (luciferase family)